MKKKILSCFILICLICLFLYSNINVSIGMTPKEYRDYCKVKRNEWNSFSWNEETKGEHHVSDLIPLEYSQFPENDNIVKEIDRWCRWDDGFFKAVNRNYYSSDIEAAGRWAYNSICIHPDGRDHLDTTIGGDYGSYVKAMISLKGDGSGKIYLYSGKSIGIEASIYGKNLAFMGYVSSKVAEQNLETKDWMADKLWNTNEYYDIERGTIFTWDSFLNCVNKDGKIGLNEITGITFPPIRNWCNWFAK